MDFIFTFHLSFVYYLFVSLCPFFYWADVLLIDYMNFSYIKESSFFPLIASTFLLVKYFLYPFKYVFSSWSLVKIEIENNFYILFSTVKNLKVDKLGNIFLSAFEVYFLLWKVFLIPDVWNNLYFSIKPSTSCRFSIYLCIFEQKIIL